MKMLKAHKTTLSVITLMLACPLLTMADPAGPGNGGDPYATPVNGGVAFVAVLAFLYGAYRLYQLAKSNNTNKY